MAEGSAPKSWRMQMLHSARDGRISSRLIGAISLHLLCQRGGCHHTAIAFGRRSYDRSHL